MKDIERLERLERVLASLTGAGDGIPSSLIEAGDDAIGEVERQVNRLIEQAATRLQERLLFEMGPIVLIRWDAGPAWAVEYVSANVEQLLGYPPRDFLSGAVRYVDLIHEDDIERVKQESLGFHQGLTRWSHEPYRLRRRDGRYTWIADHTVPIRNLAGEFSQYFGYLADITEQMERQGALQRKADTLQKIVNPVLEVWGSVLAMPVLGSVDAERAARMTEKLLDEVTRKAASVAILDLTGLEGIDAATMKHLMRMVHATALLGCRCVLSGVSPQAARLVVALDVDLRAVTTFGTLQGALAYALQQRSGAARPDLGGK